MLNYSVAHLGMSEKILYHNLQAIYISFTQWIAFNISSTAFFLSLQSRSMVEIAVQISSALAYHALLSSWKVG